MGIFNACYVTLFELTFLLFPYLFDFLHWSALLNTNVNTETHNIIFDITRRRYALSLRSICMVTGITLTVNKYRNTEYKCNSIIRSYHRGIEK